MPLSVLRGVRKPGERWTEHDTSTAVALTLYEQSLCPGCGHPLGESTSWEADPANRDGSHWYEAPTPVKCHACEAVATRTKEYSELTEERRSALRFYAQKKTEDTSGADQS